MVCLIPDDVATKEVLAWRGLHLFHCQMSSSSQKVRIIMNLKDLRWESHPIDLLSNEHLTPHFLGINPRGLLPALIDDGDVHIESNEIILYLEGRFPEPRLIPSDMRRRAASLLEKENAIHLDLRTLTFRFMFDPSKPPKSEEDLQRYAISGTGMVRGKRDGAIEREITFWRGYLENGIDDEAARRSAQTFRDAFDAIDGKLANDEYILGDALSLLDIAWLVPAQRLTCAGYPLKELHPHVAAWRDRLMLHPLVAKELKLPPVVSEQVAARQRVLIGSRKTLTDICFPSLG